MRPQLQCDQQTSFSAYANRDNNDQMLSYAGTELRRKACAAGGRCLETLICQGEVWYHHCRGCIWVSCWDDGFIFSLIFPLISSSIHPSINQTCFHGCGCLLQTHTRRHTLNETLTKEGVKALFRPIDSSAGKVVGDCSVDLLLHCGIL